ncbi:response regulator, partial [Candidatus Gracilibacteria bacterium]|nr:response regulator [Candidatus Gracilibacteria bacterium]
LSTAPVAAIAPTNRDFRAIEQRIGGLVGELDNAVWRAEQTTSDLFVAQQGMARKLLLLVLGGLILVALTIVLPTARRIRREHQFALEQNRESEQRYGTLVASLAEGVVLQLADGTIQACNASAERILGLSADQLMGRTSVDPRWRALRGDGSDFPGSEHPAMRVLRSGEPLANVTMGIRKPDGSLTWLAVNAQPLTRPAESAPYAVVTSFFDITEQRRIANELRYQKTLLECLSEAAPDGILVVSPDRRWLYVNERFAQMWHLSDAVLAAANSAVGLPAVLAMVQEPEQVRAGIEALYRTPDASGSAQLRTYDGRSFEYFSAPVRGGDGSNYGRVWFYRDITDREAVDRAKRDFVSMVSHELRTPLTSISGALSIVASGTVGAIPQRAQHMVDIAAKNSQRLIRLINDVLDSEKIGSEVMSFALQPVEVVPLVVQALEEQHAYAASLGVSMVFEPQLDQLWVEADSDRLLQVLTNLLSNALKFSPPGGLVRLALNAERGMARITVSDKGPGIPLEFQPRLFEKFAQADSSDRRRKGGTGLGLNITRAIVERLGGQISYATSSSGTSFFVDLPLVVAPPPARLRVVAMPQQVLICEDDPAIAELMQRIADNAGFRTTVVNSAAQLRHKVALQRFDCLLLDLNLPDGSGEALIAELRANQRTEQLPIVVVSARATAAQVQLPAVPGVLWIEKPFLADHLLSAVNQGTRPQILHVEDDADIVRITASVLSEVADLRASGSIAAARAMLRSTHLDAILLDLTLPDGSGYELLADIRVLANPPPVVVFSVEDQSAVLPEGVTALLVKSRTSNQQLLRIIADVLVMGRQPPGSLGNKPIKVFTGPRCISYPNNITACSL